MPYHLTPYFLVVVLVVCAIIGLGPALVRYFFVSI